MPMMPSDFPSAVSPLMRRHMQVGGSMGPSPMPPAMPPPGPPPGGPPPIPSGALGQAAAARQGPALPPFIQEIQDNAVRMIRLLQQMRSIPGVNIQVYDQGAQLMMRGLEMVASAMPKPGGGGPPGGMPPPGGMGQ